ncbi:hypothetical protein A0H81_09411 [Grifola frondosa]|uniref:Cytochrome b561 domain-containing protein n=1 Tax=Grifola frondosa TaxID=5627 RepID=A0A1C7M1G1_GRIFR|nr:hypothetical protein A0H81_09411 [Grifola frondosa]
MQADVHSTKVGPPPPTLGTDTHARNPPMQVPASSAESTRLEIAPHTPTSPAPAQHVPRIRTHRHTPSSACVIGFLGLLPLGALTARYARTFTPTWFRAHSIIQIGIAGPVIITGVALGITAVNKALSGPVADVHKRWGIALFVLYLAQAALGTAIHNYAHAIFGLLIIALAMFQVRTGFRTEWPVQTGRGSIGNGANVFWYVWIVFLPVVYFGGLVLLFRQFRQEREARKDIRLSEGKEDAGQEPEGQGGR